METLQGPAMTLPLPGESGDYLRVNSFGAVGVSAPDGHTVWQLPASSLFADWQLRLTSRKDGPVTPNPQVPMVRLSPNPFSVIDAQQHGIADTHPAAAGYLDGSRVPVVAVAETAGAAVGSVNFQWPFSVPGTHRHEGTFVTVLNADTGKANWVSAEKNPTDWTRAYVKDHDVSNLSPGYEFGHLWTGPAAPIPVEGPKAEVRKRDGDTVTMHVTSPRHASSVVLRFDRPVDQVTATAPGRTPVTVSVAGERSGTWPAQIRFGDLPAEGIDLTLRAPGSTRLRATVIDETHTIAAAPGFRPRPAELVASPRDDGDVIAVTRTVEI
ncbi:MAG: hypothetical protein LBV78_23315 [Kitasatospora sp.]|nr:hypothetical protein [Kitasatospora sp.]